ncbi:MAG TPA: nuclear transport factor 2 family protein [Steroidobacteraceae bacterium]|nr:nuclear transport factor 2 family protein [Steroidobacteraceae bacterium]
MRSKRSRISWILITLTAIGSLGGCQRDASIPLTAAEKAAISTEIDKLRSAYEAAVASGDPATLTPLLADGAVMVQPGAPDWNAMAEAARGAPFPAGATIVITPREVVALNRGWAYEFGTSVTTYTPEGADTPQQLRDTYLVVFRNTGDGWKAYREVASAAAPPGGWRKD